MAVDGEFVAVMGGVVGNIVYHLIQSVSSDTKIALDRACKGEQLPHFLRRHTPDAAGKVV
jgi:hypothetical protein